MTEVSYHIDAMNDDRAKVGATAVEHHEAGARTVRRVSANASRPVAGEKVECGRGWYHAAAVTDQAHAHNA